MAYRKREGIPHAQRTFGGNMKVGDLAEHYTEPHNWGIIVAKCMHQYQILWMDGECSWISKRSMVKKCP